MTEPEQQPAGVLVEVKPEPSPLALVAEAIAKGHSPAELNALLDFAERITANRAAEAFAEAITAFQAECPQILKERQVKTKAGGEMYKFASYDDIKKQTGPLQTKLGIVTTFTMPKIENGVMSGTCRVRVGNHVEETALSIPVPKGMNTNSAQDFGMAVTYLKRYLYCAALDIVVTDEDDDGQSGSFVTAEQIGEVNAAIGACEKAGKPVNFKAFLAWLNVETLDKLPQRDLEKALAELRRKLGQAQKVQEANK